MCGICGKINFTGKPVEEGLLRAMAETLTHRGPDDEGVYIGGSVGLGHRRLSVIDLSKAAHQPMANEDETLWIVYNGEVYNFEELKEELLAKGHRFRSHSDTEVILHLYEEEGAKSVERLRGMFAFAIWDTKKKELFLARDRTGQKPLFYRIDDKDETFHFASEIKAILKDPTVKARPDLTAIDHYMTWQCVPAPYSAFEGIEKLPPAHYMTVKDGKATLTRYWKLNYTPKLDMTESEIKSKLVYDMREAVKLRMISDVPLGAFLSGGVDSSAVVALMAEVSNQPIKTFAIGFKDAAYNELSYAKIIAERFKTNHTEFIIEPNALEILPKLVWHYGEPFADSSAIPTYYVSQLARDKVTVALNGDGGDESFAGYERYMANELSDRI
ncbi:MAG: asparagine synthase (glutamine-hydrolyzing), partial [Deltaproteobacteria bacterium]|nr:asparagine synthase (glutamine-hydrolyzing) [Deltaproteobacteria bacterium]